MAGLMRDPNGVALSGVNIGVKNGVGTGARAVGRVVGRGALGVSNKV